MWGDLVEGAEGVASGLRLSPKGALPGGDGEPLLQAIPGVCRAVWPGWSMGERAARLSHGLALPLVDAPVLATALEAGAGVTTDAHLQASWARLRVVRL
ncbi:type II toxin-antitoxin system VapC family toxin [Thermus sp.]|uniref:type II toxin-antitoxin system VapC family toxin n=1 Tax=Thermus sp. TaxID=275 RepID=UPI00298F215E|nr:type II toxin-antitoxin system VapC family toxin [Thermus sp.]MDW8358204.1 type II toxin-antitoxin system VapC family toxin [Thermus sp.]